MKIRLFHSSRPSSTKGKIDFWGRANISLSTVGLRLFFCRLFYTPVYRFRARHVPQQIILFRRNDEIISCISSFYFISFREKVARCACCRQGSLARLSLTFWGSSLLQDADFHNHTMFNRYTGIVSCNFIHKNVYKHYFHAIFWHIHIEC